MAERLLIAVGGAADSPEALPSAFRTLLGAADEIVVIAPTLPTRLQWFASDTDAATERGRTSRGRPRASGGRRCFSARSRRRRRAADRLRRRDPGGRADSCPHRAAA